MDRILSIPTQFYDYIDAQYGTVGLISLSIVLVMTMVSALIWLDRRK